MSTYFAQLGPLHFEVSGPQTQHSNGPNVNALLPPKAKIKAGDAVAAVREAVPAVRKCSGPMLVNRCGHHTCEKAEIGR